VRWVAWLGEEGQDLVEYAFLLAFVALVCMAGIQLLGTAINDTYGSVKSSFEAAGS
jgi:Flp pilus assembly pilin Flp